MVKKNNIFESLNLFNNKSAKKSYNGILIIAGILGVLALSGLVVGIGWVANGVVAPNAIVWYNASGIASTAGFLNASGVNNTYNEGTAFSINISINAMDKQNIAGEANATISAVNVTFDQSFVVTQYNFNATFGTAGVGINATFWGINATFSNSNATFNNNTGNTYHWLNKSDTQGQLLGNGTLSNVTVFFRISDNIPGLYNFTVLIENATGTAGATRSSINFSIKINDTTAPNFVNFFANSTGVGSVTTVSSGVANVTTTTKVNLSTNAQSATTLYAAVNVTDFNETGAGGIGYAGQNVIRASFYFYNDTGLMNISNMTSGSQIRGSFGFNLTSHVGGANLTDGNYMIVARNFTDAGNNVNFTTLAYNVTIDGTQPTVTVAKDATSTAHQIVLAITVSDATSGINGKQCSVTSGGAGSITMSGNAGAQTSTQAELGCNTAYTYTVACTDHSGNTKSQSVTASTDGCTGSGGTSGTSGGTSGSDVVGSATSAFWILTYNEASTDLSDDSDGVSVNLAERYRAKVKVDTKLYYVGVVDTTDTTAKINVTTSAQDKEATLSVGDVKKFDVNADNKYDLSVTLNGVDSATGKADLSVIYIQEPVSAEEQAGVEEQAGTEATTPTTAAKSKAWIWIVVVLAVLIIAGAVFFGKRKSRFKNYGF